MAGNASSKNKAVQQNPDHPHNRSRQESFVSLSIQARSSAKGPFSIIDFTLVFQLEFLLALKGHHNFYLVINLRGNIFDFVSIDIDCAEEWRWKNFIEIRF